MHIAKHWGEDTICPSIEVDQSYLSEKKEGSRYVVSVVLEKIS